ncbi:MAG: GSCFA domain-containing protein [Bacteroidales bacterium]|nr:GSCFA domain-containing protein [Bacteroidales bacterium]
MSDLFTKVNIPTPDFNINHQSGIFLTGSCFSDNIGKKLEQFKFNVCRNPFGVVYNPVSIANGITMLLQKDKFRGKDLSYYNELWFSFAHYTLFSDADPDKCLDKINIRFIEAKKKLKNTDTLFITLGTSWVYTFKSSGQVVANCHKLPSKEFERHFSSAGDTYNTMKNCLLNLWKLNPAMQVIFTVSPIRHWKDGAINNQRSKSSLITAISELESEFKSVYYFPVYEIFMDELRDYRFYSSDMLHPSEQAQEIVWLRFSETFMNDNTKELLKDINKINASLNHIPRHPGTKAYREFLKLQKTKITELSQSYPFLSFNDDLIKIDNLLKGLN